jgi:hypothetical protein
MVFRMVARPAMRDFIAMNTICGPRVQFRMAAASEALRDIDSELWGRGPDRDTEGAYTILRAISRSASFVRNFCTSGNRMLFSLWMWFTNSWTTTCA